MFEHLEMAPADPIFGLTEAFKKDPNPAKINLGVGVYQDETGKTPIFRAVKEAERRLLDTERNKSYLGIAGHGVPHGSKGFDLSRGGRSGGVRAGGVGTNSGRDGQCTCRRRIPAACRPGCGCLDE